MHSCAHTSAIAFNTLASLSAPKIALFRTSSANMQLKRRERGDVADQLMVGPYPADQISTDDVYHSAPSNISGGLYQRVITRFDNGTVAALK